jgi:hypothetical protein
MNLQSQPGAVHTLMDIGIIEDRGRLFRTNGGFLCLKLPAYVTL